ncbi:MAG: aminotransferase class IV, partial [Firmicutes bacterium]|nr:aminotransferase class IV [Bacillota bacterium]
GIEIEGVDVSALYSASRQLVDQLEEEDGSLYIQITRGVQPRAHAYPEPGQLTPTVLMWARPLARPDSSTVSQGVPVMTVPDDRWANVWLKTVNLLPNILAKTKAQRQGCQEAIFVRDGFVTEGSSSNIFIVQGKTLRTTPVSNYILPGITRQIVIELANALGIAMDLRPFTVDELYQASEAFLSGTGTEILPIATVDGRRLPTKRVVTDQLMQAFEQEIVRSRQQTL